MAYFRARGAEAIENLVDCDPCDSKQIMKLQNLIGRTDDFQDSVDALLQTFRTEEIALEVESEDAEASD